jgi:hypothetical protein
MQEQRLVPNRFRRVARMKGSAILKREKTPRYHIAPKASALMETYCPTIGLVQILPCVGAHAA